MRMCVCVCRYVCIGDRTVVVRLMHVIHFMQQIACNHAIIDDQYTGEQPWVARPFRLTWSCQ